MWLNLICEETLLLSMKLTNDIINYRFLTTETNLKALYIFPIFYNLISKTICSDCADFCIQIYVYNCVFGKSKNNTHKTFHFLKMKEDFKKEPDFGNESSF